MISFNPVAEKQERPSAKKKSCSPYPLHEKKQDDSGKNQGDSDTMQQPVPDRTVLVIVLLHVVRQARH